MSFTTRAYNSLYTMPAYPGLLIKSSREKRLLDEFYYYQNLPERLRIFFPRVYEIPNNGDGNHRMGLEYYAYDNLGKKMNDNFNYPFWEKAFHYMFSFIEQCEIYSEDSSSNRHLATHDMYISKTEREYLSLVEKFPFFTELIHQPLIFLNKKPLKSFEIIWPTIKSYITNNYIADVPFTLIHGDLCFSNMLCGINPVTKDIILKFIDPRGSFGHVKYVGDPYYDLAKISHSCSGGYEFIIEDKLCIYQQDNNFRITGNSATDIDHNKKSINDIFLKLVNEKGYDLRKIKIIEGTIFIGMCARHYDSLDRQKIMYLTGLNILNDIYEEILL